MLAMTRPQLTVRFAPSKGRSSFGHVPPHLASDKLWIPILPAAEARTACAPRQARTSGTSRARRRASHTSSWRCTFHKSPFYFCADLPHKGESHGH